MRRIAWFLLGAGLPGCGSPPSLMPMEVGQTWAYNVRTGGESSPLERIRVERTLPVASSRGFELAGPLGVSRLAWKDGTLLADMTANARLEPPLPLLTEDGKPRKWMGWIESMGKRQPAKATLEQESVRLKLGGDEFETRRAILSIKTPRTTIELRSWYLPGTGLIQQEQRTDGKLDVALQWLRGGENAKG